MKYIVLDDGIVKLNDGPQIDLSDYYTKSEIDTFLGNQTQLIMSLLSQVSDLDTTLTSQLTSLADSLEYKLCITNCVWNSAVVDTSYGDRNSFVCHWYGEHMIFARGYFYLASSFYCQSNTAHKIASVGRKSFSSTGGFQAFPNAFGSGILKYNNNTFCVVCFVDGNGDLCIVVPSNVSGASGRYVEFNFICQEL